MLDLIVPFNVDPAVFDVEILPLRKDNVGLSLGISDCSESFQAISLSQREWW